MNENKITLARRVGCPVPLKAMEMLNDAGFGMHLPGGVRAAKPATNSCVLAPNGQRGAPNWEGASM